jgi:opacity protein-like surface antigen
MVTTGRLAVTLFFLTSLALAQDSPRIDFSVSGAGVFSKSSSSSTGSLTLKPTNSIEEFGSVRFHFNWKHALEANIGHTDNSQFFTVAPNNFRVPASITEFSGAYVFSPVHTDRFSPFLLGGAGELRFAPGSTYINGLLSPFPVKQQTSLAILYGIGMDYHLWRIFAVRLQYRGLFYKNPDFGQPNLATHKRGHLAEPAAGIVVKF